MEALLRLAERIEPLVLIPGPMAPGWCIAVSRLDDGETVSGRGPTEDAARRACLGEAAELLSARRRQGDGPMPARDALTGEAVRVDAAAVTIGDLAAAEDPGTEGCGAGATPADAGRRAILERIERHHATEWWTGRTAPARLPESWLEAAGLLALVARARAGAVLPRDTAALEIGRAGPARTVVAVSRNPDGTRPVLGVATGLDAAEAARSALSELFQMELALFIAERMAERGDPGGHGAILARAAALEGPMAGRLDGPARAPAETDASAGAGGALAEAVRALGVPVQLVDLTRADIGVPVMRAHAPALASVRRLRGSATGAPM